MHFASSCVVQAKQVFKQARNDLLYSQLADSKNHLSHWLSLHKPAKSPVLAAKTKV